MKEEKIVEFEMSKEELDSIIMSLPQILKELEEYIIEGSGTENDSSVKIL